MATLAYYWYYSCIQVTLPNNFEDTYLPTEVQIPPPFPLQTPLTLQWFHIFSSPRASSGCGWSRVCTPSRHRDTSPRTSSDPRGQRHSECTWCIPRRLGRAATSWVGPSLRCVRCRTRDRVRWLWSWMTPSVGPGRVFGWRVPLTSRRPEAAKSNRGRVPRTCTCRWRPGTDTCQCWRRWVASSHPCLREGRERGELERQNYHKLVAQFWGN